MLIDNGDLVEQLQETVVKKAQKCNLNSKVINFMKDEGKLEAGEHYTKLLT